MYFFNFWSLRPPPPKLPVSSVGQYGNFLKIHINNFFLRLYLFCWALMCWLFCSSLFCVICECYRILYGGWANSWASASKSCTSQFQKFPPPPPPPYTLGIWLELSSIGWGIWPKMRFASLLNVGSLKQTILWKWQNLHNTAFETFSCV